MMEPMQMCVLHPISWTEKRDLGYHLVLPRYGTYSAADPDGILKVVLTWPLIPKGMSRAPASDHCWMWSSAKVRDDKQHFKVLKMFVQLNKGKSGFVTGLPSALNPQEPREWPQWLI